MSMLPRLVAMGLIALIVAPFSAPFSVGDSSPSLKNATTHALPAVRGPQRIKRASAAAKRSFFTAPLESAAVAAASTARLVFTNIPLVTPLRI